MDIVPQLPQTQNNQSQNVYTSIVDDCVTKRTLLVLSKGMRSPQLIAHLIGRLSKEKEHSLTILLNFKKEEIPALNEQIDSLKICRYRIKQITNENTTKRTALYVSGGIYAVSNVIMVMDLLQRAVSPSIITSLVVNDAEQVDSVLNDEAWITTMIRKENKNLKVLAITDTIDVLAANQGFRKVMHALFLEYCSVWPLSRYEILKDVTEHPDFQTYESHIKLPGPIKKLQKSIMNIIRSCIEEFNRRFKERNKGDDVLNEQDVFNTSMTVVYYKMKAIAGKFNLRGQQLLRDIFEFRMLLLHLIYYDAVEFYLKILTLKNTASFESIWYIGDRRTMEHIEELLKISKQRVFKLKREIIVDDRPLQRGFTFDQPSRNVFEAEDLERSNTFNGNNGDTVTIASSTGDMNIETIPAEKADEVEASGLDVVKNPIKYKGNAYRLDLKININFKYRALVEILKKLTATPQPSESAQQQDSASKKKKIIWIWAQEDKKVGKIKDILTSFFAKKDDHKIKLLLKLNVLLKETGDGKADARTNIFYDGEDEDYEEVDLPKNQKGKGKSNTKTTDEEAERYIFKRLSIELSHLKKEYDNKCMINLLNMGGAYVAPSQSDTQQSAGQTEETSGNKLVSMLKPKKTFKRKFYDLDEDEENPEEKKEEEKVEQIKPQSEQKEINLLEQKILQDADRNQGDDEPHIDPVTGIDMDMENYFEDDLQEIANKKVLTNEDERERSSKKQFEYTILNSEKIDLNSFYDYNDDGQVMFDPELIPGYKIIVNHLGSTSERVNFINKIQPDIVLLFEPQLSLIREIMLEKRCSKYGGPKCMISEVHVIMVQNSIESAIYLDNVRRENSSFVTLLNDRSSLPLLDDNPDSRIKKIIYQRNISTRVGRGLGHAASLNNRPMIIVDKREFNSPVPTKLYHDGFWIVPILLEKGDYVLSNSLVVERKCVETGDLLNSMRSGRLENQIRNLCSTYSRPMLLIEFSEGVDFSLESAEINRLQHNINWVNDFGSNKSEINKSNVKFGLALLCMKYPRLTILWSKSPEYTSKLFQKLREENPDPDPRLFAKFQDESEKGNDHDPYARYAHEEEKNLDVKHMI